MPDFYDLDLNTQKLCSYAVYRDEKARNLLAEYYSSLTEKEKEIFQRYSEKFLFYSKNGAKKYKISKNAILIAVRLKKECGISCFPFVEKIATKGWPTAGGTFSWSMRILEGDIEKEIFSFEPTTDVINKKYNIFIDNYRDNMVINTEKKEGDNMSKTPLEEKTCETCSHNQDVGYCLECYASDKWYPQNCTNFINNGAEKLLKENEDIVDDIIDNIN